MVRLLKHCEGRDFTRRRETAMILGEDLEIQARLVRSKGADPGRPGTATLAVAIADRT
jgi:hypothetical protein